MFSFVKKKKKAPNCLSKWLCQFVRPQAMNTDSVSSHPPSIYCQCLDFCHFNGWLGHLSILFNLQFPNSIWCWASFHVLFAIYTFFFWCRTCSDLLHIFNWVVCFLIVGIEELFVYSEWQSFIGYAFCKYYFLLWGLPFHFHSSIFHRAEVSVLMKPNTLFLFFSFMDPASVVVAKKLSTNSRSLRLSPMSFF